MEMWTKAERESARIEIILTHKMGKIKKESKPIRIRILNMSTKDYDKLMELLSKYDMNNRTPKKDIKPKMEIIYGKNKRQKK